ncbi:hypothetical protein Neosp_002982 [[Neocosmospora] mangrovei]
MGIEVTGAVLSSGADVIAIDRLSEAQGIEWEKLQHIANVNNTRLTYYKCDVADADSTLKLYKDAIAGARHPLRGLVTCAGVSDVGESKTFDLNRAKEFYDITTIGTFASAQAAAKIVDEGSVSASFVFIASMSGYIVNKRIPNTAYACSKAAVHQLTRNLAAEWGAPKDTPSIRVNSVSPGYIKTPMLFKWLEDKELEKLWTDESMLGRLSVPEDYCGPIVFLLSEGSRFMTGTDLLVDGGHTRW